MRSRERSFFLLIGLLLFAPLAFGTVEPWSVAVLQLGLLALLLIWLIDHGSRRSPGGTTQLKWVRVPGLPPLLLLLAFTWLQTLPLPPFLIKILSPFSYSARTEALSLLVSDPGVGSVPADWMSLSLYPAATLYEFGKLMAWGLAYFLSVQILSNADRVTRLTRLWVIFGLAVAAFAILQHAAGNGKIYGFRPLSQGGPPMGPYVSKNHFAGFLELILPLAICTMVFAWPRGRFSGPRAFLVEFLARPRGQESIRAGLAALVMAAALFFSLSRGGTLSFLAAMIFVGFLLATQRSTRGTGWRIAGLGLLVFLAVTWLGWSPILERFERLRNIETEVYRYQVWHDTLGIVRDSWLTGTGLGTFEHVYPAYKTVRSELLWDYTHNDYLQLAAETGLIGLTLFAGFVGSFFYHVLGRLRQRRNPYYRLLMIGGLGGIFSLLLHSLVDFNLHIGANAFLFFVLMALTVAAGSVRTPPGKGTGLPARTFSLPAPPNLLRALGILIAVGLGVLVIRPPIAEMYYNAALRHEKNRNPVTIRNRESSFGTAASLNPLDFRFPFALTALQGAADRGTDDAWKWARKTVLLNPVSPDVALRISQLWSRDGKPAAAVRAYRRAMALAPMNPELHLGMALWTARFPAEQRETLHEFRRAIETRPSWTGEVLKKAAFAGLTAEELETLIPDEPTAQVEYGAYLDARGMKSAAVKRLRAVLAPEARDPGAATTHKAFRILARIHEDYGEQDAALLVRNRAVERFPDDIGQRLKLAKLYEEAGIPYRAAEEYRKVLQLNPLQGTARDRLRALKNR